MINLSEATILLFKLLQRLLALEGLLPLQPFHRVYLVLSKATRFISSVVKQVQHLLQKLLKPPRYVLEIMTIDKRPEIYL